MGQNNVLQSVGKGRSNQQKALKICDASLLEPFVLKVFFNNNENRIIDFRPFFNTLKGDFKKYNTPSAFKKFKIENCELWWGKNADVQIHPIDVYYNSLLNPLHDELSEDLIIL
ncbi:MAG TPA: DUF2442 domain-containing protein [Hanamia sp.]|nr:DUF2442 domain-containing protein [Hanamia sp.]